MSILIVGSDILLIINGGVSRARNFGIEAASGEYLMFVDSDDLLEPHGIAYLVSIAVANNADVVCGDFYKYLDDGSKLPSFTHDRQTHTDVCIEGHEALRHLLRFRLNHGPWAKLYRKSTIGNLRFEPERFNEDGLFLFYLLYTHCKVVWTPQVVYNYRENTNGLARTFKSHHFDILRNIDEMYAFDAKNGKVFARDISVWENKYCGNLLVNLRNIPDARRMYSAQYCRIKHVLRRRILTIMFGKDYTIKDRIKAMMSFAP